jgi:hypothetical protein
LLSYGGQSPVERIATPLAEIASLQQHLRRIDERRAVRSHRIVLSLRERRCREPVLPAEPIPVIDVECQRHCIVRRGGGESRR